MKGAPSAHNAASVGDVWIFALKSPIRVTYEGIGWQYS